MTLEEYIKKYDISEPWFVQEVSQGHHAQRISNVINNRDYLWGIHKILQKEDSQYKGKEYVTKKTIINYAKTILKFHGTYLLGKPVTLSGNESIVKTFNEIYKMAGYESIDYEVLDRVNKFADAYEVVYVDNGKIKSKVLDSACGYPVYDDCGEYLAFIDYWTDIESSISYYNVYYPNKYEEWNNEGGELHQVDARINVFGLPIHYHNFNDMDYNFGEDILKDFKPILDDVEDVISKFGDGIYTNTLNPMPVATGQRIESSIPADAIGYILNMDMGDFKYVSCQMDYNSIKLYLDQLKQYLNDIANIPSVIGSSTNIANISEVSMKILFYMAQVNAEDNQKWLNKGFQTRFDKFRQVLGMMGVNYKDGFVDVIYNYSMPVSESDMMTNLKALREMGAISKETIMEKSEIVKDKDVELKRLNSEGDTLQSENNPSKTLQE